ncbi:MFS transporter [Thiothrix nivea]|uniref:Major facilitator superfamily MFS_1 n=1 Tax=Thiothrix nivea (strain ATCC 35100 / DSM 5205 / JP2) TaxID=870187 RepID=A0A656HI69_THINJ|nr:MFS transporter [Thiothrix nivea]EIJ36628.1 major facilitator superfamily MFS_1 [Thiothrix nivea DSM 5205]
MNSLEWRVTASLAAIYAVRMLGLFMILPVFALYAETLPDSTPFLAGLAIGIYGLSQAIFQIPLGIFSDRVGRKPVIIGGLLVFAAGSVIAALAHSMWLIIIGRAIQGMGAVAGPTMALAADLTREENRTRIMAVIGMVIGLSFMGGMILGPIISQFAGVAGIFWLTMLLALAGIALVVLAVPTPVHSTQHRDAGIIRGYLGKALGNASLLRMNAGVFIIHLVMTANFLVLPGIFEHGLSLPRAEHWKVYLPVFAGSFLLAIPLIIIAEKKHKIRILLLGSTVVLLLAEAGMALGHTQIAWLLAAFFLFFVGFNFLEAVQPSLVAKYSDVNTKGTAMGIFSSSQFLGIFAGGSLGGMVNNAWGATGVFVFSALVVGVWWLLALQLPQPKFYASQVLKLDPLLFADKARLHQDLLAIPGVKEVAVVAEECVAYLKVDKENLDQEALRAFSGVAA